MAISPNGANVYAATALSNAVVTLSARFRHRHPGYDKSWLQGDIGVPATNEEDLSTKPSVQEQFLKIFNLTGKPRTEAEKRAYLNYYGNLMRSSDSYIVNVLNKLEEAGLYDDTLIVRTADHGEMGLSHGGMHQKNFNFYEEETRVPLVYSNPKLFPTPQSTDALVTISSQGRSTAPTRNPRTTSSASAKAAGSSPSTTTPARRTRSRCSGRCTT